MGLSFLSGLAAFSSGVSAAGSLSAGESARESARFNAEDLELDAIRAREDAQIKESQQRRADAQVLSSIPARTAAGGLELSGSPLLVFLNTVREAEKDALIIRRGGELQAEDLEREADITRFEGEQARRASRVGAAESLLTGGIISARLGASARRRTS